MIFLMHSMAAANFNEFSFSALIFAGNSFIIVSQHKGLIFSSRRLSISALYPGIFFSSSSDLQLGFVLAANNFSNS